MEPISARVCDMERDLQKLGVEISALKATIAYLATKADLAELRGRLMVELIERDPGSFERIWRRWVVDAKRC